jgi:hypothetical protein
VLQELLVAMLCCCRITLSGVPALPLEITRGPFEVTELNCWDHSQGLM